MFKEFFFNIDSNVMQIIFFQKCLDGNIHCFEKCSAGNKYFLKIYCRQCFLFKNVLQEFKKKIIVVNKLFSKMYS